MQMKGTFTNTLQAINIYGTSLFVGAKTFGILTAAFNICCRN